MHEYEVKINLLAQQAEEMRALSSEVRKVCLSMSVMRLDMSNSIWRKPVMTDRFRVALQSVGNSYADLLALSKGLMQAAELYSGAEARLSLLTNLSMRSAPKEMLDELKPEIIQPKYPDWGTKPGTISVTEYAWLCAVTNGAAGANGGQDLDGMLKSLRENIENLPPNHMLRSLDPSAFSAFSVSGVEGFVIRLDDHSAIVIFAGTDSFADGVNDAAIVANNLNPIGLDGMNPQGIVANQIISQLEQQGYDNLTVTGHSLGGYLAADVTINHTSVNECVTFDPPGHSWNWTAWNNLTNGDQVAKIKNYLANGSAVHVTGFQIGDTYRVDVEYNTDAVFPNHSIDHMRDDAFGGMNAIETMYQ